MRQNDFQDERDPDGYGRDLDRILEDFFEKYPVELENDPTIPAKRRKKLELRAPIEPRRGVVEEKVETRGKITIRTHKVTREEVVRRLEEQYNGELELLSEYKTRQYPIRVRCLLCDTEFSSRAENFFRGKVRNCSCGKSK